MTALGNTYLKELITFILDKIMFLGAGNYFRVFIMSLEQEQFSESSGLSTPVVTLQIQT